MHDDAGRASCTVDQEIRRRRNHLPVRAQFDDAG